MVHRNRFFVASLWAALGPVGMLLAAAAWLVLFPKSHDLGRVVLFGSGVALFGVPLAYTAVVVGTYAVGRGLYEIGMLTRTMLVLAYGVLVLLGATLMTWWMAAGEAMDLARSFALFLALGLVAGGSAAFVWWRVASRGPEGVLDEEPPVRMRRRQRRGFFRRLADRL